MRPFASLGYRGQVGRMRALARRALPRFGLRADAPLELAGHGENTVFRTVDGRGRAYALRIHRLDYQTPATIRSEMTWLEALARDTDVPVPLPRRGRDGAYVQRVTHAGVPGTRSVVLMRWLPGARVGRRRGAPYWRAVGDLTARLHRHGRSWKRPRDFARRRWDERELLLAPAFGDPFAARGLRRRDRELFAAARDRILAALQRLGKGRRRWGLIHADLHAWNVLRADGILHPIDFDDCGFGWYVYDILIAVGTPTFGTPAYEPAVASFLDGYTDVLAFDEGDLAWVRPFYVTRALDLVGWIAARSDNPRLARLLPGHVRFARKACRDYLRS